MKQAFLKALSIGVHGDLSESRRLAIQLGTLDAYWTFVCIAVYFGIALHFKTYPIAILHFISLNLILVGLWLLTKKRYDLGRFLIHFICIYEVFLTVDCYPANSGIELFYIPTIMIPFITFSVDEQWKGNIQVVLGSLAYIVQHFIGTGVVFDINPMPVDRGVAIGFVISYMPLILGFLRWQVKDTKDKLVEQQKELLHSSTMKVIGEMSVNLAHEINNPLQSLSLQLSVLKDKNRAATEEEMQKMEMTIQKMGKMIHGIKELGEKSIKARQEFHFSKVLEDILILSAERIKEEGIQVYINGDSGLEINGHSGQIAQVLMNLLNHAFHSVKKLNDKGIWIELSEKNHFLQITVSTKATRESGWVELNLSKSIVEKNKGSLFLDESTADQKHILLLPLAGKI